MRTLRIIEQGLADEVLARTFPVLIKCGKRVVSDTLAPGKIVLAGTTAPLGIIIRPPEQRPFADRLFLRPGGMRRNIFWQEHLSSNGEA